MVKTHFCIIMYKVEMCCICMKLLWKYWIDFMGFKMWFVTNSSGIFMFQFGNRPQIKCSAVWFHYQCLIAQESWSHLWSLDGAVVKHKLTFIKWVVVFVSSLWSNSQQQSLKIMMADNLCVVLWHSSFTCCYYKINDIYSIITNFTCWHLSPSGTSASLVFQGTLSALHVALLEKMI